MTVVVTDNRTIKDEADNADPWTAAGTNTGKATGTADPYPIEATAHVVTTASSTTGAFQWFWHTGTSLGTGPHLIYIWCLTTAVVGTRSIGGLMILIGDGTNRVGYNVGGSDVAPFRSDSGETETRVGYMCFVIDTDQLATWPHGVNVQNGTRAGLESNLNAITQVGTGCWVVAKAVGGSVNFWNDIVRYGVADNITTSGLTISGGTSGSPGKWREIAVEDRSSADKKAHGIIRELGDGLFGVQGTLRFGDQASGSSWFEDANVTVVFENRNLGSDRYKIIITDNGTGTTTFKLGAKVGTGSSATGQDGCSLIIPTGVGGSFDAGTDTDVTDVFIYGSTFSGFTNGIKLGSGQEFIGCNINASGTIDAGGATMFNTNVSASTASSALLWNANSDTNSKLDGMNFISGGTGHAIELGSNTPIEITFTNIDFTGYASSDGSTGNEALYNNSGKAITVNVTGGTTPTVRNGTGASTTVVSSVPLEVKVIDTATNPIQGAQVAIYLSSDDTEVLNTTTNVSGIVSGSFGGTTPANIYLRVRKSSSGDTKYVPSSTTGTITSGGFSITITLREDLNA